MRLEKNLFAIRYVIIYERVYSEFIKDTPKESNLPPVFDSTVSSEPLETVRKFSAPVKVLWQTGNIQNPEILLLPGTGQADLSGQNLCVFQSDGKTVPSILLDFGKEIHGGIQLVSDRHASGGPVKVHVRFGESAMEAMSTIGYKNATNDNAVRDFTINVPWLGKIELGDSGFRFVRIDLVDFNTELKLKEARAILKIRDIPYLGSFSCSDSLLNNIWLTGDMNPEVSTICAVFGYNDVVPKSLDGVRDLTPTTSYINTIISYTMWWVLIQHRWYMNHGNLEYLEQQKDYLVKVLEHFTQKIDANNSETLDDGWRFIDWPSSENPQGVHAAYQALMVMTLNAGSELCTILKVPETAKICDDAVTRLKTNVPDTNNSKQAAALLALADMASPQKMNDEVISVGGVHNFSTFFGYYMLQAKAKAGDHQGALDAIRTYWGAMINLGATTFWEDFSIDWITNASRIDEITPDGKVDIHGDFGAYCYQGYRHSFCHGWASGPTPWLTEHVLGVNVLAPGCRTLKIDPHLGDLKFAEGTFPTPYGVVEVKHTKQDDGKIRTVVNAPNDVEIILTTAGTVTKKYDAELTKKSR